MAVLNNTRTYKVTCQEVLHLRQGLAAQRLILHFQRDSIRLHVRIGFFLFLNLVTITLHIYPADIADNNHGKNNTHHPQRISTGISHGNFRSLIVQLLQSFIRRTKSRSIGNRSTQDTHHHRNVYSALQSKVQNQCYGNIQEHNSHCQQV